MPGFIYFHLERPGRRPLLEGRNLQGCALALLRGLAPKVSELLHEQGSHLWSACAPDPRADILRVGLARDQEMEALTQALFTSTEKMEARLGEEPIRVAQVAVGRGRARVIWPALGGEMLEHKRLRLTLMTPMFFRDGGRDFPDIVRMTPSPERILGSLIARVKRMEIPLPGYSHEAPWRYVSEHSVTIKPGALKVHFNGRPRTFRGATGSVEWRLRDIPDDTARWLLALLDLGRFTGVGSRTSMGLGALDVTVVAP